jgi:large subunit ribosomal protein L18
MSHLNRKSARRRVHRRIRKKIAGTAERPRLAVHFSNCHVYAQVIDDDAGKTLVAASTAEKGTKKSGSANTKVAATIGKMIADKAKSAKIEQVVFDRGGFVFHGKVKALADAARDAGLQF